MSKLYSEENLLGLIASAKLNVESGHLEEAMRDLRTAFKFADKLSQRYAEYDRAQKEARFEEMRNGR